MKKIVMLAALALSLWGCVTFSQAYKQGNREEMNKNWDEAIKLYERAVIENPKESVYRLALLRAKLTASLVCLQEARKLAAEDKKDEAVDEYKKALSYDPLNRVISEELRRLRGEEVKEEKPRFTKIEPPIKLKIAEEKIVLNFPIDVSLRSIFQALGKHAGVNIIFDENFRDIPFSIDLRDMGFEQAMNSLCMASKNFFRVIDERTVIVAPDQPLKRVQYELNAIRTFYLSNISAQEVLGSLSQMLRTQFKAPNIIVDKNLNSVTIRDTPMTIELAERLLRLWDKPKGEVIVDLEIMEVSRIKLRELGVAFDQNIVGFRYQNTEDSQESGWLRLNELDFGKSGNYQVSIPGAFLQFLESDADTKMIAQPRLRGVGDEEINYMVGQKVPIPQTTFTPIAAGGISQQPVVSFTYQDVGITVKVVPRIHFEDEVSLEMDIEITSIGGAGVANIPIITTRKVKNVIRLKNGETNLLAGLLKDEERKSLKGIPGIKDIPLVGRLFATEETNLEQTDVVLTITPYIIRTLPLTGEDEKPLWVDIESISVSGSVPRGTFEQEIRGREAELEALARRREELDQNQNRLTLSPANFELPQNRDFRISVNMFSQQEISSMSLNISFNPQVIKLKEVNEGGLTRQLGERVPFLQNIDNASGTCTIGFSSPEISRGAKGSGSLAILVFESSGQGESIISVSGVTANSPTGQAVSFQVNQARVLVR